MTTVAIVKYKVGKGDKSRVYTLSRHETFDGAEQAATKAREQGYKAFVSNSDEED